ncbi:MAG: PD-(D/E)XK nuclease family transposase [Synergistaceae bacterium]|nr:PD-(D/E)XK nuclease family transposase [Synergistaceae bacterium]
MLSSAIQETLTGPEREVRLDILATDKKGRKYDIEFQRANKGAKPKRARYHSSMIDVRSLEPGTKTFEPLPEVYVIFITEKDILKGGLPIYTIDRVINETGKKFGDESHIIYVNASHKDRDTALGKLIHDLLCVNPDKMNYKPLAERTRHFKQEPEGVIEVAGVWEESINIEADKRAEKLAEKRALKLAKQMVEQAVQQAVEQVEQNFKQATKDAAQAAKQEKESFALRMLQAGKLALDEIVEYSGLSMTAVKRLAKTLKANQ